MLKHHSKYCFVLDLKCIFVLILLEVKKEKVVNHYTPSEQKSINSQHSIKCTTQKNQMEQIMRYT